MCQILMGSRMPRLMRRVISAPGSGWLESAPLPSDLWPFISKKRVWDTSLSRCFLALSLCVSMLRSVRILRNPRESRSSSRLLMRPQLTRPLPPWGLPVHSSPATLAVCPPTSQTQSPLRTLHWPWRSLQDSHLGPLALRPHWEAFSSRAGVVPPPPPPLTQHRVLLPLYPKKLVCRRLPE